MDGLAKCQDRFNQVRRLLAGTLGFFVKFRAMVLQDALADDSSE
jgi:hypothetical protein